ncbi:unnamed protein product [Cylicocyclus nassatus]|uniref:SCP domain-containing protein n=1 Tax=Cylicocyclus nassatus TaxID=53992 RepID=A0AA36GZY7_CYLNA|nr:unnamed protein product [Cylicocyclus nassatus]
MLGPKYLPIFLLPVLGASEDDDAYCKNGAMSKDDVNQILTVVNELRTKLANGLQESVDSKGNPITLPAAKNMRKMAYDCALERKAANALDGICSETPEMPQNENGYFISYDFAVKSWKEDIYDVQQKFESNFIFLVTEGTVKFMPQQKEAFNYANLMRGSASNIGCAVSSCLGIHVKCCFTDQSSIQSGEQVYELGTGENCECDGTLTCENSLCVEALAEFPGSSSAEPSTWCGWSKISDTMRMHMKDTHNFRRSTLALGQVIDNTGAKLPAATNMNYLVWNCTLEKEAHDYLGNCPTEGYQRPADNSPAQNFYRGPITVNEPTWRDMNKKTITEWWKPSRKVAGPGQNAHFRIAHNSTSIKSYTLMGWASSRQLGCSIAKCGNDWVEACRYYPPGNKVDSLQYKPGTTCSQCSRVGAGPCNAQLGLCG